MSSFFQTELERLNPSSEDRSWLYVPYDQLSDRIGPLSRRPPQEMGIVLVESRWKAAQRPYHRQKLALLLANQRHFALEQAERGVAVCHVRTEKPFEAALEEVVSRLGPLRAMRPAEYELRRSLEPLSASETLRFLPHEGWLTTREQFEDSAGAEPPWRMDRFYRRVRRDTGWLMEGGKPVGGKFSFDAENRKPWKGEPAAPDAPRFEPTPITAEVCELVESSFSHHPGRLDPGAIAASREQVEASWRWALEECMEHFGPYEDAMTTASTGLFHTRVSALVNLHRLLPSEVVRDVVEGPFPLACREGFLRQVLGWREFVRHVHESTEGLRRVPGEALAPLPEPGDAGYGAWAGEPWPGREPAAEGGARPAELGSGTDLPPVYWGRESGLDCLDRVVADVWDEGWSHHITRLMILANLATLLGVDPRQLTDWFWVAYVDAFDWVVEPNVLGMGTFAAGPVMTTKPYVSGAAYIHRMSDYCRDCAFDPKRTCPITPMYWAFLDRHRGRLAGNPRLALPLRSLEKRGEERRRADGETAWQVAERLARGERLTPETLS